MRLKGLLLAVGKATFFNVIKTMLGGLVFITLLLAFLYLIFGRERRRS